MVVEVRVGARELTVVGAAEKGAEMDGPVVSAGEVDTRFMPSIVSKK
jgi:hypothetical protein